MSLKAEGQDLWNEAYNRGGNVCLYPHEEIIRFVNKYIRKKRSFSDFENVMPLDNAAWKDFASLDLGCGIGRHVKFLDEFGLNPYGIDLSDNAISMGKAWMNAIGKESLAEHLIVASAAELPFKDQFFNICVSHGTLDSMPREIAEKGLKETYRVLKSGGLMYFDLIMDVNRGDTDEIQGDGYEKDTVQSYFTTESIKSFIGDKAEILEFKIISWQDDFGKESSRRAHLIIRKK